MVTAAPGTAGIERSSASHQLSLLSEDKVAVTGDVLVDAGEGSVPESAAEFKSKGHFDRLVWFGVDLLVVVLLEDLVVAIVSWLFCLKQWMIGSCCLKTEDSAARWLKSRGLVGLGLWS